MAEKSRTLLIVGSNPPVTSGNRTLGRADLARQILGFDRTSIANLFSLPTYRTGGMSLAGLDVSGWREARSHLLAAFAEADAVLLAYGTTKPSGAAAQHYLEQVAWIEEQIVKHGLEKWLVGGEPRHPSRWQRYTYRAFPGVPFHEALRASLGLNPPSVPRS